MMQQETVMKKFLNLTLAFAMLISLAVYGTAQKKAKAGRVCGDPTVACKNRTNFQPNDLPFDTGKNFVIAESEPFYAIVLKSGKRNYPTCEKAFPESERLSVQELFPHNMVFASRCSEPGDNYYDGFAANTTYIAVYAGRTSTGANAFLKKVKATAKFPGVRVRRTKAGINGT